MKRESDSADHNEWPELVHFKREFRKFVAERDWDQFHSPKNLAMALAGEIGELLEHFQWLSIEESRNLPPQILEQVANEIADIQIYLATMADRLGVEIGPAVTRKMKINAEKYPAEKARGSARKYTAYSQE